MRVSRKWVWILFIMALMGVIPTGFLMAGANTRGEMWHIMPELRGSLAGPRRSMFVRKEKIHIVLPVDVYTQGIVRIDGRIRLIEGDKNVLSQKNWSLKKPPQGVSTVEIILDSSPWRCGEYAVEIWAWSGRSTFQTNLTFGICPEPDRQGFVLGMLDEQIRRGTVLIDHLRALKTLGFSSVMHYQPTPELMEAALSQRINALGLLHGDAAGGGFKGDRESLLRLNARGVPFDFDPANPRSSRMGIAHPSWQMAVAARMEVAVRKWEAYPGFWPIINTSDDFYRWTGLDYNSNNVVAFRALYGTDPPRPPEALAADYPLQVAHPKGIISNTNLWVLWQQFNSRDVLGRYNGLLADAVRRATKGKGMIGPVCGGGPYTLGTVPLVDLTSGQWPPYNFGPDHFSLNSYYNYNCYWFPAIAQIWWAELARMGNREATVWVMPDTMDLRRTYHLQNAFLFLAGGVDGLMYFIYEWSSPGSREALSRLGPDVAKVKDLLGELKPAPRPLGILMPFENACFRASYPADASYAFANLAMAHAEVEPVWPEELTERHGRYRALLLYDVDWLTEANLHRLRDFQKRGGRVIADAGTEIDWPGLEHLNFDLAHPLRDRGYGDARLIAKIRKMTEEIVEPWAQSDDPQVVLRHFQVDGVDYLWVVHLMTYEEDAAHSFATPGKEFKVPPLPEYAEYDRSLHDTSLSVPDGTFRMVADVMGQHPPVEVRSKGRRSEILLSIPGWQGRLLAFYPCQPDGITIVFPGKVKRGQVADCRIEIQSAGRPVPMAMPLAIEVIRPDGTMHPEFSRTLVARRGSVNTVLDFARNEVPGDWVLRVREATTGISTEKPFSVR